MGLSRYVISYLVAKWNSSLDHSRLIISSPPLPLNYSRTLIHSFIQHCPHLTLGYIDAEDVVFLLKQFLGLWRVYCVNKQKCTQRNPQVLWEQCLKDQEMISSSQSQEDSGQHVQAKVNHKLNLKDCLRGVEDDYKSRWCACWPCLGGPQEFRMAGV